MQTRIGLISDTHGLLRPEAKAFLQGCDFIIHGGDIGNPGILEELAAIAPLTVVRGNNDTAAWARALPESAQLQVGDVTIHVLHDIKQLALEPAPARARVIVSGHSHRPSVAERGGIMFINPGSAGRRRFKLPITLAELRVSGTSVLPRILEICSTPA